MNICLISPTFHPVIGGGETHVRTLAEGMARLGHSVTVLTDRRNHNSPPQEWMDGVEVLRTSRYRELIDEPDRVPWEEILFGLLREFSKLLKGRSIDIIHAHCQVSAILGAMIKESLGCRLVVTMHETQPELDPFGVGRSRIVYAHLPYDILIACSQFFREQALRHGAAPERVRLVYHGVDLTRFTPSKSGHRIRAMLGVRDDQPLVLLAGRFKPRKGLLEFVRAMARVISIMPDVRGLITGSCNSASLEYANTVRREIETLGLKQVVSIQEERFSWEEMPEVYAAADLVVQPSYAEGLGLSILEAMATAKPVIGTAVSGIQEIITHGKNGLLVPPKESDSLAHSIIYLLSNPGEAARLAANGYSFVQQYFSAERMIQETLEIYHEILAA